MIVVVIICSVMLILAGILALIRAERGPTMLNRTIALDVFATVLIGGVILEAAYSKRLDTLPILVVLSLVGFVGSVTIARFAAIEPGEQKRVRTAAEVALEDQLRRAAEEAQEDE